MLRQIDLIAKDLAELKTLVSGDFMIGRLCFRGALATVDDDSLVVKWSYTKRQRGQDTIIKVLFDESYALESVLFMSAPTMEDPRPEHRRLEKGQSFTRQEVLAFVEEIGDPNELHRGIAPIVPGLMVLEALLNQVGDQDESFQVGEIKFLAPLYTEETFFITDNYSLKTGTATVARLTLEGNK